MSESKSRSGSLRPNPFQNPASARRAIRGGVFKALKRTFRRWGLLSFLALICLGLGILVAQIFGKSYWTSQAYLINPGNPKQTIKSQLASFSNSQRNHNPSQELADAVSWREFSRNFSVINPPGTYDLNLKLNWTNPETGGQILDSYIEQTTNEIKQHWKDYSTKELDQLTPQLTTLEKLIAKLKTEKANYLSDLNINDPEETRNSGKSRISFLENQLFQLQTDLVGYKSDLEEIKQRLHKIILDRAKDAETDSEVNEDTLTPARLRQDRIKQLLNDEETRIDLLATLSAKEKEKALIDDLFKQNKSAKLDQLKLENEIQILKAKLNGNRKTNDYNNEINKLDRLIVPDTRKKLRVSPAVENLLSFSLKKQAETELQIISGMAKTDQLQKEMDAQRARQASLIGVSQKSAEWDSKILQLETQKKDLETKIGELDSFKTGQSVVPVRYGATTTGAFPSLSTKPALFYSVFFGGFGVSFLLVFLMELVSGVRSTSDIAKALKIPVQRISSTASKTGDYRDLCRVVRNPEILGKTVLQVQPFTDGPTGIETARQVSEKLAEVFSRRGETVVLVDLAPKGGEGEGLAEFLGSQREALDGLIQPTSISQVFRIGSGKESIGGTALAGPRMKVFLETLQNQFGVIIIQGLGLARIHEVEALGTLTQGSIVVSKGNGTMNPEGKEALLDLAAEGLLPRALVIV